MNRKMTTPFALAIAGAAVFASHAARAQADDTDPSSEPQRVPVAQVFERLDSNDDGRLSRAEAQAAPRIAELYSSLDTSETLEAHARESGAAGITLEQFEAGLQAADTGGVVGSPVSGGETLLVYPDGTHERVKGTGYNSGN